MAELAIPLKIDITADGSAAVSEINSLGKAAQSAGQNANSLASGANNASSGIKQVGDSAKNATDKLKTVSESLTKIGSSMTKLVTAPIVAAYTASVKGAADLTETVSKTETVFGSFYANVEKWSETSIESMGIAQSTALEMASLYGDMATGMGFSQDAASEMSMELTSLAADLASFKNISVDVAENALKSIFTGETETLKNLGVVMTEANLKAYMLAEGITKSYDSMSQAEKVTLRYQYVMAQTANAQGDFERTGDSLSNKFRKLTQTIKQVGEQIGTLLIPFVTQIVDKIQSAVQWFSLLDDGIKNTILQIGAIVAAIGPALLIGTKVVKLVQSIKAALALTTLNPMILALTAAVTAAALLVKGFTSTRDSIDKTSASYQTAKSTIEKGITTKVTVDSKELDELEGKKVEPKVTVRMSEEGKQVVKDTKNLIDELQKDENFEKSLVINGNSEKAKEALDSLETAISELLSGEGDGDTLADLQAAIDACEELMITPGLDEATYQELQAKLEALKEMVATLKDVSVSFTVVESVTGDIAAWNAFHEQVESLGWTSKTFHATGEFDVSSATTEAVNDYASAMFAAASATSDYGDAVDKLNSLLEEELQRQIEEIQAQATEKLKALAIAYSSGYIDEETFYTQADQIIQDVKDQTEALKEETEQAKELNETLNNGTAADDSKYTADQFVKLYSGDSMSTEDMQGALAYLSNLKAQILETGEGDMSDGIVEAGIALAGLETQAESVFSGMTQATSDYNTALDEAAKKEQEAAGYTAKADKTQELYDTVTAFKSYMGTLEGNLGANTGKAIDNFVDRMGLADEEAQALKETMTELFTDEEGNLPESGIDYVNVAVEQLQNLHSIQDDYNQQAATATEEAATAQQEAAANYQAAMQQIVTDTGLNTEAMIGALQTIQETGMEIPEVASEKILSVSGLLESLNSELEEGAPEVAANVASLIGEISDAKTEATDGGTDTGEALVSGIEQGLKNGSGSLYTTATQIINSAIERMENAAEIHSPSHVTRDRIGKMLMRGVSVGIEDETPSVLERIKSGMNKIISGAQAVVSGNSYSFPMAAVASNGLTFDYGRMGEALSSAVQDSPVSLVIKDKVIAETTSDATWRAQAIKAQRINRGKGRW